MATGALCHGKAKSQVRAAPRKNTDNLRPEDPEPRLEHKQYYTRYLADTSVTVGAASIGGRDSVKSPPSVESRRKPVINFTKGTAMSRCDFADRWLLAAPLT
jgi:hypothetical protein